MGIITKKTDKIIKQRIEDKLDYNYSASTYHITTLDEFDSILYKPFVKKKKIYYRGERINSSKRLLLPSLLRDNPFLNSEFRDGIAYLDNKKLFNFYKSNTNFTNVFNVINKSFSEYSMYSMLAFAQHYMHISPFIDFTKSLYVALSFAFQGKTEFSENPVIYTIYDIGHNDTSSNLMQVNRWIQNYNVAILDSKHSQALENMLLSKSGRSNEKLSLASAIEYGSDMTKVLNIVKKMYPEAKLIDIPTNDLMKYQQGVFLLLNNFTLVSKKYLTKSVRQNFIINKYVIDKSICPQLVDFLNTNAPHYKYEYLQSISRAIQ